MILVGVVGKMRRATAVIAWRILGPTTLKSLHSSRASSRIGSAGDSSVEEYRGGNYSFVSGVRSLCAQWEDGAWSVLATQFLRRSSVDADLRKP